MRAEKKVVHANPCKSVANSDFFLDNRHLIPVFCLYHFGKDPVFFKARRRCLIPGPAGG